MNGWFPRLNVDGAIASGDTEVWVDGQLVVPVGGGPAWAGRVLVYDDRAGGTVAGAARVPVAYNSRTGSDDDRWAGFAAPDGGRVDVYRTVARGRRGRSGAVLERTIAGGCVPRFAPGTFAYLHPYAEDYRALIVNDVVVARAPILDVALGAGLVVWQEATSVHGRALLTVEGPISIRDDEAPIAVFTAPDGTPWIATATHVGVFVRPLRSAIGYRIAGEELFYPDARMIGDRLRVVGSTGAGVPLFDNWIDFTAPREDLAAVAPKPPDPKPPDPPEEFMDPWLVDITQWGDRIAAGEAWSITSQLGNGVAVVVEKTSGDSLHVTVAKDGVVQDRSGAARVVEVVGAPSEPGPEPPEPGPEPAPACAQLRTYGGYVLTAPGPDDPVHAEAKQDGTRFAFEPHGDRYAIRVEGGRYLRAEGGGDGLLFADRDAPHLDVAVSDELFTVQQHGAEISIASRRGRFVCAELGGGGMVPVDRPSAGIWETFTLDPPLTLRPARPAPALVVDGEYFRQADGTRWTGIQTSEFSLLKRWLEDEDVAPVLEERAALGFNLLRVWTLNESVVGQVCAGGIHPAQYPDFYPRLRAFAERCGTYGFAVEFTAFTSCIPLMPDVDDQTRHWVALQDAVRGLPYVLLELVNEYDWGDGQNAPDRSLWNMRPVGILASSGLSTADAPPSEPVWDYVLYHTNGLSEWQRRVGHNAWEWGAHYRCPGASNENMRYPDDDDSTLHAYDAAAGAALLCAAACFHSQGGKYARPFDPVERAAAEAWVAGARSVPLEFQPGQDIRRDDLLSKAGCSTCHGTGTVDGNTCPTCDGSGWVIDYGTPEHPGVIRAFERLLSDGRSHVVLIHA